jgi:hypothetical protein
MYPPPADPWEDQQPMYGRASVPVPSQPLREPTAELPMLHAPASSRPVPKVSWHRPGNAARRSLSDGWGFTATGLLIAFCGWGVWAAAGRGTVRAPLVGLGVVLVVAAMVFALSRVLGFIVLGQLMHRSRPHARWSHLFAGLFMTLAGISYLVNTKWMVDFGSWIDKGVEWLGEQRQLG